MPLLKTLRALCDATDVAIFRRDGNTLQRVATTLRQFLASKATSYRPGIVDGRAIVDRQIIHVHDVTVMAETSSPSGRRSAKQLGHRTLLVAPLLREGDAIGAITIRRTEVRPFTEKQIALLRPSPTKRSSRSRTSGCSKKSRSATRNCAKRWSIRRRHPRCSASSAARRRMCSRCSTRSSRAPRGFVESMTWCCDSAKATDFGCAGSFWSHRTDWPRRDQY